MERSEEIARRARANQFRRNREQLAAALTQLLGARHGADVVDDAARAESLATEARAAHLAAEEHSWAVVRHEWPSDDRTAVTALLHAVSRQLGPRPVWLIVPQRGSQPQVAALSSDAALDNPLGFAALADHSLMVTVLDNPLGSAAFAAHSLMLTVLDRQMPAGLWLGRHSHHFGPQWKTVEYTWELEVWGTEPWLSAATRAVREAGGSDAPAG